MSFLTAEWRKIAIANYAIDKDLLKQYVPFKTELDIWEDTCYISLIGFLFKNTKIYGIKVPFHAAVEEVNLRFYVRYKENNIWKRGAVFIREFVPKPMLTLVANSLYNEQYRTVPMSYKWLENENELDVRYDWKFKKMPQSIRINANPNLIDIEPNSETEFITEHYWGYTKAGLNKTFEYGVTHPRWQAYHVNHYNISVDFAEVYGEHFKSLDTQKPTSVMLIEGSAISIEGKKLIL